VLQIFRDTLQEVCQAHVDVLGLVSDMQVELKHARHVMEEHVEGFRVLGGKPLQDLVLDGGQHLQVADVQVNDGFESRVLEDDEVKKKKISRTLSHNSLKMQPHTQVTLGFTSGLEVLCGGIAHAQPGTQTTASQWQPTKRH